MNSKLNSKINNRIKIEEWPTKYSPFGGKRFVSKKPEQFDSKKESHGKPFQLIAHSKTGGQNWLMIESWNQI